jgi:hypothetical protein
MKEGVRFPRMSLHCRFQRLKWICSIPTSLPHNQAPLWHKMMATYWVTVPYMILIPQDYGPAHGPRQRHPMYLWMIQPTGWQEHPGPHLVNRWSVLNSKYLSKSILSDFRIMSNHSWAHDAQSHVEIQNRGGRRSQKIKRGKIEPCRPQTAYNIITIAAAINHQQCSMIINDEWYELHRRYRYTTTRTRTTRTTRTMRTMRTTRTTDDALLCDWDKEDSVHHCWDGDGTTCAIHHYHIWGCGSNHTNPYYMLDWTHILDLDRTRCSCASFFITHRPIDAGSHRGPIQIMLECPPSLDLATAAAGYYSTVNLAAAK